MYPISYRFLVPGWSAKPLVSAHDRIMGTHRDPAAGRGVVWVSEMVSLLVRDDRLILAWAGAHTRGC